MNVKTNKIVHLLLYNVLGIVCAQQQNGLYSLTLNYVLAGKRLLKANILYAENVGSPVNCATKCYVSFYLNVTLINPIPHRLFMDVGFIGEGG